MVYFIGHCVLIEDIWAPLTNVPVDLVDLGEDSSSRTLDRHAVSLQLVWQEAHIMRPLYDSVIKTHYITKFQRRFREKMREMRRKTLPRYIFNREIGVNMANR